MLAVLLLAQGRPVPIETLIDRVWGDDPPAEVRQSLQADIYRLRRMLKSAGVRDQARITAIPGAYALEVDPEHVDVFRSRRLGEQASAVRRTGDVRAAAALLREALGLWRSEPLTGLAGEWFDQVRASLDGDYRAMAQELVDAELAAGNHAETVGFLVDLNGRYPLDETFVGQLMVAYYRCGRQADAIDLYLTTTRRLREDTGADPSPPLQAVYQNILRHDPSVESPRRTRLDGIPGLDRFPAPVAEFTGRATEIAELSHRIGARTEVVAIEGMPGVGKTALAVKLAHQLADNFPDGCVHLHLHAHDPQRPAATPTAALFDLLRQVGVAPTGIPRGLADRARLWRGVMEGRRALILLDDAADSDQVRPLLPGNPDCRVIITSRRHLAAIDGAYHHRLGVLAADDAADLFARIAAPETGPPAAATDAVRLCGGLPLAIGLAAARLRDGQVTSIEDLAEELRGPHEDIADLQDPALAATFALSYRDLPPPQQRVFRLLGVSPASELTAPAVAVLAGITADEAERDLADLVEHYLLEEISPGRYRFHDLVRQYALARATREDSAAQRRRAVGRMLDFFLWKAYSADRVLYPHQPRPDIAVADGPLAVDEFTGEAAAKDWLAAERENLFHLVQYAAGHEWNSHVIDYARTVARYLDSVSQWEDAETVQRCALKVALSLDRPQVLARVRFDLAVVQWRVGQIQESLANANEARDLGRRSNDAVVEALALDLIGLVMWSCSSYREAFAYFGEALDTFRGVRDAHGTAQCLDHLGMMLAQTGRHREALRSFHDGLDISRRIGDLRGEANISNNLAETYLRLGYHRDAIELFQRSYDIYQRLTGRRNRAILTNNFGEVERYRGRLDSALRYYREALSEFSATGDRINESNALNNVGFTLSRMDKYNRALIHHQTAMSIADGIGNTAETIRARIGIGDVDAGMGRYPAAMEHYEAARGLARGISDPYLEAQALTGIAHVTSMTKGREAARIHWRQAYDLFCQMDITPEAEAVRIRLEINELAEM